jgi:hypothetical protein
VVAANRREHLLAILDEHVRTSHPVLWVIEPTSSSEYEPGTLNAPEAAEELSPFRDDATVAWSEEKANRGASTRGHCTP